MNILNYRLNPPSSRVVTETGSEYPRVPILLKFAILNLYRRFGYRPSTFKKVWIADAGF